MSYYQFSFDAPVERLAIGTGKVLYYNVIFLPEGMIADLPFGAYPRLRVIGEVAETPVRGAWQPVGDGRKYFILSAAFLKTAGLALGQLAEMRFNVDDQDHVDIPPELAEALDEDPDLQARWNALTPGKKRFHGHHLQSAKTEKTRAKRLAEVLALLK